MKNIYFGNVSTMNWHLQNKLFYLKKSKIKILNNETKRDSSTHMINVNTILYGNADFAEIKLVF